MIYLNNNTKPQEIFIERNDGNGNKYIPQPYLDGYEDGMEYQKSLLSSTTFTENGEYERENGWSAITVNVEPSLEEINVVISADTTTITPSSGYYGFSAATVDATEYGQQNYEDGFDDGFTDGYSSGASEGYDSGYTEGYQSGSTDGYESGYTSGTTDGYGSGYTSGYTSGHTDGIDEQKALLTTTALTENGSYQRENGWSGVTVNVDTASTYNSGYTSGHTDGVSEEKAKLSAATFTANTAITISDGGYSAITVNVPQSGSTEKDIVICTSGGCWFSMNYRIEYGDVFEIEHCTFGKAGVVSFAHQQYLGGNNWELFRLGEGNDDIYLKYFNNSITLYSPIPQVESVFQDNTIVYSSTAFTVDGNIISSYTTNYSSTRGTLIVFANTSNGGDKVENQIAKIGRLKVYASDGTLKATFEPRLDEFNVPYFKYIEQDIDIYASGNTAPFYEEIITDPSYQSGYTDGYADGENAIIGTFTATTATTNGVYGSSANPLSSITVNVPQTGSSATLGVGSFSANGTYSASTDNLDGYSAITINVPTSGGVNYVEYIETNGTKYGWEIPLQIGYNSVIEMDFMPLAGSPNSDGWYSFFVTNGNQSNLTTYWGGYNLNDVGGNFLGVEYSPRLSFTSGTRYLFELDNTGVRVDNVQVSTVTKVSQSSSSSIIYINSGNDFARSPIARYYGFKVYDNGTLVWDLRPCLDSNNNPCFYETISEEYYYHTKFDSSQSDPTAGPLLPTEDYLSGYTDGMAYQKSLLGDFTATTNGSFSAENGYSGITVLVPQTSSFGDLYCLYCDEDCIFDFAYTINRELASIEDINFSALPLSDFTIVYKGDLDGYDLKMGNMKWTDEGNGYYHFSGNWETYYNTYNTNDSTSRAINDFPNMHFFDWKIYATKTYTVDSDDLTISSGGGAPTHTSDLSISGNSYYLGNVSVDNQYCLWYVAVDNDGNGCLRMGNEYKYPSQGNCYPVYRKLVNGTYVYRIVKPANESSSSSTSSDINKLIDRSITSIEIPSGVTTIGAYAFANCESLTSVTIPNTVTSFGKNAFYCCTSLSLITIPNGVTSLAPSLFSGCTSLSEIIIPSGITKIGLYCFQRCYKLKTIYAYPTTAPSLGSNTSSLAPFSGVSSTGIVHYPQGSDYSSWQSAKGISGWTFVGDL